MKMVALNHAVQVIREHHAFLHLLDTDSEDDKTTASSSSSSSDEQTSQTTDEDDPLKCSQCQYRAKNKILLRKHAQTQEAPSVKLRFDTLQHPSVS